jgi:hypothetical protein
MVDLGAVTLMYVAAGGLVLGAALAGLAWGVPALMDQEPAR